MQHGLAVDGGRVDGRLPDRATLDADDAAARVGHDGVHRAGAHDHDVVEALGGERPGVVAGALGGDPQSHLGGDPHDRADLGGGVGYGDRGGALVDRDVPRQPGGVVPGVSGEVDASGGQAAQGGGGAVVAAVGGLSGQVDGHGDSLVIFSV